MVDRSQIEYLSPSENKGREIDSLGSERSLLLDLEGLLALKTQKAKNFLRRSEAFIENLSQKYRMWQSFGEGEDGLNSGGIGEAFARLVGGGILQDFPEIREYEYHSKTKRIFVDELGDARRMVNLKIEVDTEIGGVCRTVVFQFNCSLNSIRDRCHQVEEEIEAKRKQYYKLREKE